MIISVDVIIGKEKTTVDVEVEKGVFDKFETEEEAAKEASNIIYYRQAEIRAKAAKQLGLSDATATIDYNSIWV